MKKINSKYDYLLKEYPSVITKDQFYRICGCFTLPKNE